MTNAAVAEQATAPRTMTVLVEAYAASDYGDGPQYARFQVDDALAGRLAQLQTVLSDHKLSEARSYGSPELWGPGDIEGELRLNCAELVVVSRDFWFTDQPKHADYHIETRAMDIEALLKAFNDGVAELYLGNDIAELKELVAGHAEDQEGLPA